jgi:CheY-like chemotaxis protein
VSERAPTLLVIEDARDQAVLVGAVASSAVPGLAVHIAGDGQEGIDFLAGIAPLKDPAESPTPDLVILDLMMPVVDGFGVLEWIREHLGSAPFPVVVFTGSESPEHEQRARELGAADVLRKPTGLDGLGESIRGIVSCWISQSDLIAAHMRQSG